MGVAIEYTGVQANGSGFAASGPTVTGGAGSGQFDETTKEVVIDCILTLSGSYVAGGDPVNFGSVAPPIGASLFDYAPSHWSLNELQVAGTALSGFHFSYLPGPTLAIPTQAGGVLQITGTGAASGQGGTQLSAGAYSGSTPSLDGVRIKARFWFGRN